MPFEKGKSGNPGGKPQGALSGNNKILKNLIADLLQKRWKKIEVRLDECDAKDELYFITKMMDFVVAKPAPIATGAETPVIPFTGVLEQKYKDAGAA